jgi:hypothetical protein
MSNKILAILGTVAVVGTGIYFYAKTKSKQLINQFDKIKTGISALRNFDAKWNDFKPYATFNLDLKFTNPTDQDFRANGIVVKLKRILMYDNQNRLLGTAIPNVTGVSIAKNSSTTLKNIPVRLEITASVLNIIQIIQDWKVNPTDFTFETVIDVLGIEYKTTTNIEANAFDFKTF